MSKGKLEEIFFSQKQLEKIMANENISIIGRVVAVLENKKTGKKKILD